MKTENNVIVLEDAIKYSPTKDGVNFTDVTGTKFHIPIKLLVRLYEGTKFHMERNEIDWDRFLDDVFKQKPV